MAGTHGGVDVSYKIWECSAGHWLGETTLDSAAEAIKVADAIQARGFGAVFIQPTQGSERIALSKFREMMGDDT